METYGFTIDYFMPGFISEGDGTLYPYTVRDYTLADTLDMALDAFKEELDYHLEWRDDVKRPTAMAVRRGLRDHGWFSLDIGHHVLVIETAQRR